MFSAFLVALALFTAAPTCQPEGTGWVIETDVEGSHPDVHVIVDGYVSNSAVPKVHSLLSNDVIALQKCIGHDRPLHSRIEVADSQIGECALGGGCFERATVGVELESDQTHVTIHLEHFHHVWGRWEPLLGKRTITLDLGYRKICFQVNPQIIALAAGEEYVLDYKKILKDVTDRLYQIDSENGALLLYRSENDYRASFRFDEYDFRPESKIFFSAVYRSTHDIKITASQYEYWDDIGEPMWRICQNDHIILPASINWRFYPATGKKMFICHMGPTASKVGIAITIQGDFNEESAANLKDMIISTQLPARSRNP